MYIVLYIFKVKPNQEKQFIASWKGLTNLIYKYEGSLGSKLHINENQDYIAYAQWPDKSTFEKSGKNLPDEANNYRDSMRASREKIEVLHKMEIIEDMLI